ncbi:MAG TPA: hypothetical protein VFH38_09145 [Jatrophihabitans sp.]|nr:hypothetical protein [Jatrophihabitans sp.]
MDVDPHTLYEPVSEPIGPCDHQIAQLRSRIEHLERVTLAQALENEQLADENERLRVAAEARSGRLGFRTILRKRDVTAGEQAAEGT